MFRRVVAEVRVECAAHTRGLRRVVVSERVLVVERDVRLAGGCPPPWVALLQTVILEEKD